MVVGLSAALQSQVEATTTKAVREETDSSRSVTASTHSDEDIKTQIMAATLLGVSLLFYVFAETYFPLDFAKIFGLFCYSRLSLKDSMCLWYSGNTVNFVL